MGYTIGNNTSSRTPFFPKYSAVQQFTPFTFYRDFIIESINRGLMDDILANNAWLNTDFKYYAYDLDRYFTNIYTYFTSY